MSWADRIIEQLKKGAVTFHPSGHSMEPRIMDGQMVTVAPVSESDIKLGDVVLCKVGGRVLLHLVVAVIAPGGKKRFQIGNNKGRINGWATKIYGKLVS